MTKETLLHATDLYTTIQKIEQLLTIFEKNSIEEVKVRGFDWKPSTCLLYTSPSPRDRG